MSGALAFLSGKGQDHRGRTLDDLLALDDAALEYLHDYVQWLFPLPESSRFNARAPVLSAKDIAVLRADAVAAANLRRAATRMLSFYDANDHWLTAFDHNHLRITRIIRCLALILGRDEAETFHRRIEARVVAAGEPVNAESRRYWREAIPSH
ncbi:MAG: opioid growth factor receptor-related protein [Parvibaculaceae bacterium]